MFAFNVAAILMLVVALGFVIYPLLRPGRGSRALANAESNVAIFRQQRQEILREFESGVLTAKDKDEALGELTLRAGQELVKGVDSAAPSAQTVTAGRPWAWAAGITVLVPLLVIGLYAKLGSPEATRPVSAGNVVAANPEAPAISDKQILAMVDSLAEKLKQNPSDAQGWMLLGRSQNALGRFAEAAQSFERASQLTPKDAQMLADYADALAMAQGGNLEGKPSDLVKQALSADPQNKKALAIAGTAELNRRNFKAALDYWERLQKLLPVDSDDFREVGGAMNEIRMAMGKAQGTDSRAMQGPSGKVASGAPGVAVSSGKPVASPSATSVAGKITITPDLAKTVTLTDTLYIFARAANWQQGGPRMPLAVLRVQAKELPRDFELTDAMAMAPNVKISDFPEVVIEARVSKSGNAAPQSGDLQGVSNTIKPGVRGVAIVIDRVVK